jgi:hypothetical protein
MGRFGWLVRQIFLPNLIAVRIDSRTSTPVVWYNLLPSSSLQRKANRRYRCLLTAGALGLVAGKGPLNTRRCGPIVELRPEC